MGDHIHQSANDQSMVQYMIGKVGSEQGPPNPRKLLVDLRGALEDAAENGLLDEGSARKARVAVADMEAALDGDAPSRWQRLSRAVQAFTSVAGQVAALTKSADAVVTAVRHMQ
jgi:hypothetical protein